MPPQQRIFTDDLVTKNGEIGLVERAPNSSDDEDDEEDDIISDEPPNPDRLPPGSAKVGRARPISGITGRDARRHALGTPKNDRATDALAAICRCLPVRRCSGPR